MDSRVDPDDRRTPPVRLAVDPRVARALVRLDGDEPLSRDDVLGLMLSLACQVTSAPDASFSQLQAGGKVLQVLASWRDGRLVPPSPARGDSLELDAIATRRTMPYVHHDDAGWAYLGVPVLDRDNTPLGILSCLDAGPRVFTPDQVDALALVASVARRRFWKDVHEEAGGIDPPGAMHDAIWSIVGAAPSAVWLLDAEGRILQANRSAARLLGRAGDTDPIGQALGGFLAPPEAALLLNALATARAIGEPVRDMHRSGANQRGATWALETIVPVRNPTGEITRFVCYPREAATFPDSGPDSRIERDPLHAFIETIPEPVFVKDAALRFTRVNPAAVRLFPGLTEADLLGKTDADVYPPEMAQEFLAVDRIILETGEPIENLHEQHGEHPATARWMLTSKAPITDERGAVSGLIVVSRNMTDLKRVELAVEQERDLLQLLIDTIPDPAFVKDAHLRFLRVNRAWLAYVGAPDPQSVLGKTDEDFFPPDLAREFAAVERQIIASGIAMPDITERHGPDDDTAEWFLVSKSPLRDRDGEVTGLVGVTKNITRMMRADAIVKTERDLLQSLIDALQDRVVLVGVNGEQRRRNKAALAAPASSLAVSPEEIAQVVRSGRPLPDLAIDERQDGQPRRTFLTSKAPVFDTTGKVTGLILRSTEITDLQQAGEVIAEALQRERAANAVLDAVNQSKTKFIANVSHELRTPLTAIQGYADLLLEYKHPLETVREYAREIVLGAERLTRMINDVLELERLREHRLELHRNSVNLNDLVVDVTNMLRPSALGHDLQLELDPALPAISGDPHRLLQVLTNVAGNALKYTPDGGAVRIRTWQEDGAALISVRDEGIGIPADELESVFDPYMRSRDARETAPGTGLGLAIARQIVELHGGRIWVESELGQGSIFTVRLPTGGSPRGAGPPVDAGGQLHGS